jgi:hypothetical protein
MKVFGGFMSMIGLLAGAACVDAPDPGQDTERIGTIAQGVTLSERIAACSIDPRVVVGVLHVDSCVGGDLFFRETFNGNGRSCATCHPVAHNMTIDPAFIATLPANDPLFVAQNVPALAKLEVPAKMRQFGVILENVDGFSDPTRRFVLRSVPHTFSMSTSITNPAGVPATPANRTGWSGDGAPGNGALRDFQTGAITQHYPKSLQRIVGTDFRLATSGELDRIDRFMRQFGRLNELNLAAVVMTDAGANAGRLRFLNVGCHACHGNAGANASFATGNFNFNTGVESARNIGLAEFPLDGGFLVSPTNPDGSFGDRTFNTPPLIEAADTGPFFHTATTVSGASAHNVAVANTIEEAIAFYDSPAFNNSPSGLVAPINLTAQEIDNIGRFLRGVNAAFNIAIASRRIEAVGVLLNNFIHDEGGIRASLIRLAAVEAQDALRMLSQVTNLNPTAKDALSQFIQLAPAFEEPSPCLSNGPIAQVVCGGDDRDSRLDRLRSLLSTALSAIGTNLTYQIGDSVLMF